MNDRNDCMVFDNDVNLANQLYHDGSIPPVVGAHNYQAVRANRQNPPDLNGIGNTYNHQPYIANWNNRFYLSYLGSHHDEHGDPTETFLTSSVDGVAWERPKLLFPAIEWQKNKYTIAHQRMGFYVSHSGRFLTFAFYGTWDLNDCFKFPNNGIGIGRVVREIYQDGTAGPVYFIRYMAQCGYNQENTKQWYRFYKESDDQGFIEACEEMLSNKLVRQQWWEEDRAKDGFFSIDNTAAGDTFNCKAFCFYHRHDGKVAGVWKMGWTAVSEDEGSTWSAPVKIENKPTINSKEWAQQTRDGKFADVWNPVVYSDHRYPLCITVSDDGIVYKGMGCVHGEVPVKRFTGWHKEPGPYYVRGIVEGNGVPPDNNMWVTYSVNKEDIWISKIPLPVKFKQDEYVNDSFENYSTGEIPNNWNIYSPAWAPVRVEIKNNQKVLCLRDKDLYDYAKAARVFRESEAISVSFALMCEEKGLDSFEIDLLQAKGKCGFRIIFDNKSGYIKAISRGEILNLIKFYDEVWYEFKIEVNCKKPNSMITMWINGAKVLSNIHGTGWIDKVQRIEFRTGAYRREDARQHESEEGLSEGLPGCDYPIQEAVYNIRCLIVEEMVFEKNEERGYE